MKTIIAITIATLTFGAITVDAQATRSAQDGQITLNDWAN